MVFLLIALAVIVIWAASWTLIDNFVLSGSATESNTAVRGQFGDKFGAINSLFAGLAFAGIIFTILLQRGELIETRKAISHERFDTTFFELLNFHKNVAESVETRGGKGKDAFVSFHETFIGKDPDFSIFMALRQVSREKVRVIIDTKIVSKLENDALSDADVNNIEEALKQGVRSLENFLDSTIDMHEKKVIKAYSAAAEERIDDFAHYFRNLYNILKFINESDEIDNHERVRYAKFVRSQLSEAELVVIFYNSISKITLPGRESLELGYPKMGKLLIKYNMLHNMSPKNLIHKLHTEIFNKNNVG